MASLQTRILKRAAGEIGYSRWSDSKRGTKYARETQPALWPRDKWLLANGISYCDIFVTWVFWKEGLLGILPAGASYNTDYRASKGGRISKGSARPGDVLVFDWNPNTAATNHVGILEKRLSSGNIQTIEGNTSVSNAGSQSNGGRVARRTRRWSQVKYVIRPRWESAGGSVKPPAAVATRKNVWETSPRIKGMSRAEVKSIQTLLVGAGYSVGKSGIDGSYKADTVDAVRKAQKALKLDIDGVAGPDTVAALKKAQKAASKPAAKPASKPASKGIAPLVVDGKLGKRSAVALQLFLNSRGANLKVDGKIGSKTWEALQHYLKAPFKDGKISRQSHKASKIGDAITQGWEYTGPNSKGSQAIKLLQKWVGVKADGIVGPDTVKALQRKLNEHKVGYAG